MKLPIALPAALADRLRLARSAWLAPALGALALAAGVVLVSFAGDAVSTAHRTLDQSRALQRRTEAELEAARALDLRLRPALERYQALSARGVIGEAPHAQWPDRVARTLARPRAAASDSTTVRTTFAAARPVDRASADGAAAAPDGAARLRLVARPLQIEVPLRHEGELLDVLARLEAERSSIVLTRACNLDRLPPAAADHRMDRPTPARRPPTLRATCLLEALAIATAQETTR